MDKDEYIKELLNLMEQRKELIEYWKKEAEKQEIKANFLLEILKDIFTEEEENDPAHL